MYSISSATHITTTKDFNQSFFPELSAGANVVVSGSGIGTGVYSRSSDRGEFDRTVPVGVGFVKVFWSETDACLRKATGVAGSQVLVEDVPVTQHLFVANLAHGVNRFSFVVPFDLILSEQKSVIQDGLILHPYSSQDDMHECLVLQRDDVCYVDRLTSTNNLLTATLVFYSAANAKSICTRR